MLCGTVSDSYIHTCVSCVCFLIIKYNKNIKNFLLKLCLLQQTFIHIFDSIWVSVEISNKKEKVGRKKCAEHLYFKYPIIQGKRRLYSFLSYCSCLSLRDCIAIFMFLYTIQRRTLKFEIPFSSPLLKSFFSVFFFLLPYKYCLSILMFFFLVLPSHALLP